MLGLLTVAAIIAACSPQQSVRVSADEVKEIEITEVPASVMQLVMAVQPGFKLEEVQKKVREGRIYYDIEGELPGGAEIEFDVLMTDSGPEIVEVQRDIAWAAVPQTVRAIVDEANTDGQAIARIIESVQTDTAIIYEVFAADDPSDPKFEVWTQGDEAKLLPTRWKH